MKAAFLTRYGKADDAFEIRETSVPVPLAGEVLIRTEAFGLNFADVLARMGLYREAPPLPCVLGYDLTGIVDAVGEGVDSYWLGKRVAALTRFGAYSEFVATPLTGCVEIPPDMPAHAACAIGTQYATAFYCTHYVQPARTGEIALVHAAAGGVGTALVQLLQLKGCRVFATAGSDEKVSMLQSIGVHAVNYRKHDYEEVFKSILGSERFDVSYNSIAGSTYKKDMRLLGAGGRIVLYGFAERSGRRGGKFATLKVIWDMGILAPILLMASSKSIIGVNMLKIADFHPAIIQHCLTELVDLWNQKKITPVNGGEYSIEQLGAAHQALEERKTVGKVIVKWK